MAEQDSKSPAKVEPANNEVFKRLLNRKYGNIAYDIKTKDLVVDCKAWHWKQIESASELSPLELDFIQELIDRNNLAKIYDLRYELRCAEKIPAGWKQALRTNKITFVESE